jgi:hypothetical protein
VAVAAVEGGRAAGLHAGEEVIGLGGVGLGVAFQEETERLVAGDAVGARCRVATDS